MEKPKDTVAEPKHEPTAGAVNELADLMADNDVRNPPPTEMGEYVEFDGGPDILGN